MFSRPSPGVIGANITTTLPVAPLHTCKAAISPNSDVDDAVAAVLLQSLGQDLLPGKRIKLWNQEDKGVIKSLYLRWDDEDFADKYIFSPVRKAVYLELDPAGGRAVTVLTPVTFNETCIRAAVPLMGDWYPSDWLDDIAVHGEVIMSPDEQYFCLYG